MATVGSSNRPSWDRQVVVALTVIGLIRSYADSPHSHVFEPKLKYGAYTFRSEELTQFPGYRFKYTVILVTNDGNEVAHDVLVHVSGLPKGVDDTHIRISGYRYIVERIENDELLLRIKSIPVGYDVRIQLHYMWESVDSKDGGWPHVESVHTDNVTGKFDSRLYDRCERMLNMNNR